MTKKLRALLEKKQSLVTEARTLLDSTTGELEGDGLAKYETLKASIQNVQSSIDLEKEQIAMEQSLEIPRATFVVSGGQPRIESDPRRGFESFGEFASRVHAAAMVQRTGVGSLDERLTIGAAAPSTYGNESVGIDGGFTVPQEWRSEIMEVVTSEESLFSRTEQLPISRNSLKMPVDQITDWDTTSGIQAYWEDEVEAITGTKPKFDTVEYNARKIAALVPVSDDLLEDNTAMDGYLRTKAPKKIAFKVDLALIRGTGVGQPLGILNSPALISVAKEGGQAADTIVRLNINKMWMRMPANQRRNAVWVVNQDIETQIQELQFVGTESPVPLYMPNGGLSQSPFDTLKGRPILYHQATSTLGDQGDIMLVYFPAYQTVVKRGGVKIDVSMHLYFDAMATAFRFVLRIGGQPMLSAAISPRVGTNTLSPFVTLDERA